MNHDNPHDDIPPPSIEDYAAAMDGDDSRFDAAPSVSPHPDLTGSPMGEAFEEGGDFDDDTPLPGEAPIGDATQVSPEIIVRCADEPPNDTGNGKRLLNHFGDTLLHVTNVGWFGWADTRWRHDPGKHGFGPNVVRSAQVTAARIVWEADAMSASPSERRAIEDGEVAQPLYDTLAKNETPTDEQRREKNRLSDVIKRGIEARAALAGRKIARRKYAITSGNGGKIKGMIEQAAPHRNFDPGDLDKDKLAFNVLNGTVHFVRETVDDPDGTEAAKYRKDKWSVVLKPHDRAANITKVAPVNFDPGATCPAFDIAINRFQPIEPVRQFLQRYHGYALTGLTGEQCLVFNYGTGSNWKSTFIEIVSHLMGDYSMTLAFESLSGENQKGGSQASPDIARLPGARLVRASEPERGVHFKEALIKSLTGGEPMLTRHNYGDFFEFRPDFKLVLSGNHKPEISGVDHGIWRRIRFVPWPVTISEAEKRPMDDVMKELLAESSGILNWLIAGTLDYLNAGLRTPQEVIDATNEYREEMDPVGNFVGDCVVSVPENTDGTPVATVFAREMFRAFQAWAPNNAVRAWKERGFATAMSQKGFKKDKHRDGIRYLNVRLVNVPKFERRDEPTHPADAVTLSDEVPL